MLTKDPAVRAEIQEGVVEGDGPSGTVGDGNGHRHVMGAACGSDALRLGTRDGDRLLSEPALQGFEVFGIGSGVIVVQRVARNERLREDSEPPAMLCNLGDTLAAPLSAAQGLRM